jgi:hypothetical protein
MVGQFQGFTRDLHDLMVQRLVDGSGVSSRFAAVLTEGLTRGRSLDRANAGLATIKADFARLGLAPLDLGTHDARWAAGDSREFGVVFELRNALAHGNERELQQLRARGTLDTVTWARGRVPVLNRVARSLDHLVWDGLKRILGTDPWR